MVPGKCEEGTAYASQHGIVSRHVPLLQGDDSHQGRASSPTTGEGGGNIAKRCKNSVKIPAALYKSNTLRLSQLN